MMRYLLPTVVAGVLSLMAWPVMDEPSEPALEFVRGDINDWNGVQTSWAGNVDKRDDILMSAVWTVQTGR